MGHSLIKTAGAQKPLFFANQKDLVNSLLQEFGSGLETARCLTWHLTQAFWDAVAGPSLPPRAIESFGFRFQRIGKAARQMLSQYAAQLAGSDVAIASFEIGSFYMALLPAEFRAAHGIYYTPPRLVSRLLDIAQTNGIAWESAHVLDPACGGGAFVAPVVARKITALKADSPRKIIREIGRTVKGLEIDPFAAWLSQVFADVAAIPLCRAAGSSLPILVEVTDALQPRGGDEGMFDLVVGNPPYNRVTLAPEMRERYSRSLYGHANLYGMFTDQALRLAKSGGVVAFVTPTSFLGGQYFQNLRSVLRSEASPLQLEFVSERSGVFEDVLQETMLAAYRKGASHQLISVGAADFSREAASFENIGRFPLPKSPGHPWLLPRTLQQKAVIHAARHLVHTLRDYGYGVNTGPLVWNRFKSQMEDSSGENRFPIIWAESVTPAGKFSYRAEKRNHAPYFRWKNAKHDWLLVDKPCVLVQRTTAKEQPRRLISAVMPASFVRRHGAVVVENHLNMVRPAVPNPSVSLEAMAAVLRSEAADTLFRCINGSVAVSAYELESLPLPGPKGFALIDRAIRRGTSEKEIEKLVSDLYTTASDEAAA